MRSVSVQNAKAHLSALVDQVAKGETVVITEAGLPVARLVPHEPPDRKRNLIGFLAGRFAVPDDFDRMHGFGFGDE